MPVFWIERTAVSRPEPGPFTCTSTRRRPCSMAALAARSAACWAANGRALAAALEADAPDDAHEMTLPDGVGDRHDRVVERALDVHDARRDVLAVALARAAAARLWLRHCDYFLTAFFLLATVSLRALAGAGVGVGALTADRESLAVADALEAADLDLALDVGLHVAAQVALDR